MKNKYNHHEKFHQHFCIHPPEQESTFHKQKVLTGSISLLHLTDSEIEMNLNEDNYANPEKQISIRYYKTCTSNQY